MIATAVGHYPRIGDTPEEQRLRRAIQAHQAQKVSAAELRAMQDDVTAEVLAEQARAGLDQVTDGQIRWDDGQTYLTQRLEGFERGGMIRYFDTNTYYRQPIAVAKVRWKSPILVEDFCFAQARSRKPVRVVLTGPYTLARLSADQHYRDLVAFTMDLADALHSEARALVQAGATVLQVDEPALTLHHEDEPLVSRALARIFDGLSVTRAAYLYHGPQAGLFDTASVWPVDVVGFDLVTEPKLIDRLAQEGFPKAVGAGLVNARNTKLESADSIAAVLRRVTAKVPAQNVHAGPHCGLEFLPRARAFDKLVRLVEGVRRYEEGSR